MDTAGLILDAHTHAFPDAIAAGAIQSLAAGVRNYDCKPWHNGTVAGLRESMDRAGIAMAILCSVATKPTQVARITDWSASIASQRIVPFASIHPDFEQPEAECERIASLGLRGIKFHSQYMNCAVDDPRAIRIARAAAAAGLAIEFHAGQDLAYDPDDLASPARLRRVHQLVPNLRMLACHLGGWRDWPAVREHLAGLPIWLETSFTLGQCPRDLMLEILDRHPPDRIAFGTDSPWADQAAELALLRALPIPESRKRAMLWDNARAFAGLDANR